MVKCDNQCETCNKYTSAHYNGCKYKEYDCLVAGKTVKVVYDDDGNEIRRETH